MIEMLQADLNGVIALSRGAAYALDGTIAFWQIVSENLLDIKEMINENTWAFLMLFAFCSSPRD